MKKFVYIELFDNNDVEKIKINYNQDTLLIFGLFDYSIIDYIPTMHQLVDSGFDTAWIFNEYYRRDHARMPKNVPIIFLNNMIAITFFQIHKQKLAQPNLSWNHDTGKFLFLTGKPVPRNRSGLLYDYYQDGLLEKSIYSFFLPDSLKQSCRDQFLNLSDSEYEKFINDVSQSPDSANPIESGGTIHYSGIPFDKSLFTDTSFRVISETWNKNVWITEKTYITIVNHQPFIMAGWPGSLEQLRQMGFRTFEKYLPVSYYDEIQDHDTRMEAVVKNTKFWLENISNQEKEIREDVEHNVECFYRLVNDMMSTLEDFALDCDIDCDPYLVMPLYDITDDWIRFYYNIKDPSWPPCYHHNQFHLLPDHVKQECIEIFGYQPRNQIDKQ